MAGQFKKMGDLFKQYFDQYGESVGFEIEGQSKFTTYLGAFVSLWILIVTYSYAYRRFNAMLEYQDSTHLSIVEPNQNLGKVFA